MRKRARRSARKARARGEGATARADQPLRLAIAVVAVAVSVFIFAGGVYVLLVQPAFYGLVIWPNYGEQTVWEGALLGCSYAMGITGLIVAARSTRVAHKPRQAVMMLLVGVTMLVVAFAICQYTLWVKIGF